MSHYGAVDERTLGTCPLVVSFAACHQGQSKTGVQHGWLGLAAVDGLSQATFVDFRDSSKFEHPIAGSLLMSRNIERAMRLTGRKHSSPVASLCIGGDHTVALGSVMATRNINPATRTVWIDAHADMNTPDDSLSGNSHGMPMAHLLGLVDGFKNPHPLKPHEICYIGVRSVDDTESARLDDLKAQGALIFTADQIVEGGIEPCLQQIHDKWAGEGDGRFAFPVHMSLDIDAIDPSFVTATGTPESDGLAPDEICAVMQFMNQRAAKGQTHLDVVELNPYLSTASAAAATLGVAHKLLAHWLSTHKVLTLHGYGYNWRRSRRTVSMSNNTTITDAIPE